MRLSASRVPAAPIPPCSFSAIGRFCALPLPVLRSVHSVSSLAIPSLQPKLIPCNHLPSVLNVVSSSIVYDLMPTVQRCMAALRAGRYTPKQRERSAAVRDSYVYLSGLSCMPAATTECRLDNVCAIEAVRLNWSIASPCDDGFAQLMNGRLRWCHASSATSDSTQCRFFDKILSEGTR